MQEVVRYISWIREAAALTTAQGVQSIITYETMYNGHLYLVATPRLLRAYDCWGWSALYTPPDDRRSNHLKYSLIG